MEESTYASDAYVRCFGGVHILRGGTEVSLRSTKHVALLVYLFARPGRLHDRGDLSAVFWDSAPRAARRSLSQALYDIRHTVGIEVEGTRSSVVLPTGSLGNEIGDLESLVAAGDHVAAVGLYGGPFAQGLEGSGTKQFERWLDTERRRLRELALAAFRSASSGAHPLEGDARGHLLRAAKTLVDPTDPQSRQWLDGVLRGTASMQPSLSIPRGRLIGREEELSAALTALSASDGCVVVVEGIAGIGKTRLLQEIRARLSSDMEAIQSSCVKNSVGASYQPVLEAFERLAPPLGELDGWPNLKRLLGHDGSSADAETSGKQQLHEECRRFLERYASDRPLLWVLDDVQWLDADTASVLRYLLRRGAAHVRFVAARRSHSTRSDAAESLLDSATRINLGPMTAADVAEMVVSTSEITSDDARTIADLSDGNPLHALHLAQEVARNGLSQGAAGKPTQLSSFLSHRLRGLPLALLDVLEALAVVDPPVPTGLLQDLVGQGKTDLEGCIGSLSERGLVNRGSDGRVSFSHSMVQQVVLASIGSTRLQLLHREVARAISAADGEPAAIAAHYAGAGDLAAAFGAATHAARLALAKQAYRDAARLADLASSAAATNEQALAAGRLRATALHKSGSFAEACDCLSETLRNEAATSQDRIELGIQLSESTFGLGDLRGAVAVLKRVAVVIDELPPAERRRWKVERLCRLLPVTLHLGDVSLSDSALAELAESSESSDPPLPSSLAARATFAMIGHGCFRGPLSAIAKASGELESIIHDLPRALRQRAYYMLGMGSLHSGLWEAGLRFGNLSLRLAEELCDPTEIAGSQNLLGIAETERGAFSKAGDLLDSSLALYSDLEDAVGVCVSTHNRATLSLYLDQPRVMLELLAGADSSASFVGETPLDHERTALRVLGLLRLGETEQASPLMESLAGRHEREVVVGDSFVIDWVRACHLLADSGDRAGDVLGEAAAAAEERSVADWLKLGWLHHLFRARAWKQHSGPQTRDGGERFLERLEAHGLGWFAGFSTRWMRTVDRHLDA